MVRQEEVKVVEITRAQDLGISKGDFVVERKGRFRDYYQIGMSIGQGAYGEVRKCISKVNKESRAVKIIRKDTLKGTSKESFFNEIEIMKRLDHPNILKLFEVYQDEKRYYLITEL
mmetsp:Transcript_29464/g.33751  ORF Transcript_29464/g.33751 Transcript_29464/m.33751 type:complete len:116 (-) Transcript_29464:1144-1491(-)